MPKSKKLTPKELYWVKKSKEEQERAAYPPPGLINHGNTCFMNSVLQGFFATDLLRRTVQFQSRDCGSHVLAVPLPRRSPLLTNGRGPKDVQQAWCEKLAVGDIFIRTLERAWTMRDQKNRTNMSPKDLLAALGQKYDQYLDFRQQDAHEFFIHLLDCMRMEEIDVIKKRQPPLPKKATKYHSNTDILSDNSTALHSIPEEERLMSFVDMIWGGRFTSYLICTTCKHVSHTYEDFDDLSLPIRHDESKERKRDRLRAFASKLILTSNGNHHWHDELSLPRAQSQPPSPPLTARRTGERLEDIPEVIRRRSFESTTMSTIMSVHSIDGDVPAKPTEEDVLTVEKTRERILEEINNIATPASNLTGSATPDSPEKLTAAHATTYLTTSSSAPSSTTTLPTTSAVASSPEPWSKKVGDRISRRLSTTRLKSAKLGDMMRGTKDKVEKSDSEAGGVAAALEKLTGKSTLGLDDAVVNPDRNPSRFPSTSMANTPDHERSKSKRHSGLLLHHRLRERGRESRQKANVPTLEREALEATYLTRILQDISGTYSAPLQLLSPAIAAESSTRSSSISSSGLGSGSGMHALMAHLSRLNTGGTNQNVEDCLRSFTAVEALDGDNMFGCHNCWKISHGKASVRRRASSDDSSDEEESKNTPLDKDSQAIVRPVMLSESSRMNTGLTIQSVNSTHSTSSKSTVFAHSASEVGFSIQRPEERGNNEEIEQDSAISSIDHQAKVRTSSVDSPASSTSQNSTDSGSVAADTNTPSSCTSVMSDKALTIWTTPESAVERKESVTTLGSVTHDIPTIAMTMSSPLSPGEIHEGPEGWGIVVPMLNGILPDAKDVLRLPERKSRAGHPKDGFSSESSVTSEDEQEISNVSDASSVSAVARPPIGPGTLNSPRRTRSTTIPKSKQVIYRRALKRYLIADPPPILVIHLKRFQQVSKSSLTLFGNFKKLDDYVSFPERLNLQPFLAPRKEDYGLGRGEMEGKIAEKGTRMEDKPRIFRLYAVIVHIGNLLGGHYVAYVALPPNDAISGSSTDTEKDKDRFKAIENGKRGETHSSHPEIRQWCYISDTDVKLVGVDEVLKAKAYLCMYERID